MNFRSVHDWYLIALLTCLASFACTQKKNELVYMTVEQKNPEEDLSIQDESRKDRKGGGVVDGSGGDLIYANAGDIRYLTDRLPQLMTTLFHRVQLVYGFSKSPDDALEVVRVNPSVLDRFPLQQILKDILHGNQEQNLGVMQVLSQQKITFNVSDSPCLGHLAKDSSINNLGEICIHWQSFLQIPADNLERHLLSLMTHEIAHFYGFDEKEASNLQNFFLGKKSFIVEKQTAEIMLDSFQIPLKNLEKLFREITENDQTDSCSSLDRNIKDIEQHYYMFKNSVILPDELTEIFESYSNWGVIRLIPSCLNSEFSDLSETEKIKIYTTVLPELFRNIKGIETQLLGYLLGPDAKIIGSESDLVAFQYFLSSSTFLKLLNQSEPKKLLPHDIQCTIMKQVELEDLPSLEKIKSFTLNETFNETVTTEGLKISIKIHEAPDTWRGQLLSLQITALESGHTAVFLDYSQTGSMPATDHSIQTVMSWNYNPRFTSKFSPNIDSEQIFYLHCSVSQQ